ncbi:MAG: TonB-dependent receptor [Cyclobacteriaceae bacterium]
MSLFILTLLIFSATSAYSQHTIHFRIVDADSDEPLPGATATPEGTDKGGVADTSGLLTITNIPAGEQNFVISYVGYQSQERTFEVPVQADEPIQVALEEGEELEEVVVTATRSSRTIDDIPTRIEVLTAEELGEKAVMNSTNIAMLLRESTGILMQQTSASSANQSIRIQGLDGRYTQLLRDGFPLYAGFAGGLSIMQIPPIDLKQVEVIKAALFFPDFQQPGIFEQWLLAELSAHLAGLFQV